MIHQSKINFAMQGKSVRDVPTSNIETETVRLECKCKQMLEWKRKSAAMLASYDCALKVHL